MFQWNTFIILPDSITNYPLSAQSCSSAWSRIINLYFNLKDETLEAKQLLETNSMMALDSWLEGLPNLISISHLPLTITNVTKDFSKDSACQMWLWPTQRVTVWVSERIAQTKSKGITTQFISMCMMIIFCVIIIISLMTHLTVSEPPSLGFYCHITRTHEKLLGWCIAIQ